MFHAEMPAREQAGCDGADVTLHSWRAAEMGVDRPAQPSGASREHSEAHGRARLSTLERGEVPHD
jgi:hypothetical protein